MCFHYFICHWVSAYCVLPVILVEWQQDDHQSHEGNVTEICAVQHNQTEIPYTVGVSIIQDTNGKQILDVNSLYFSFSAFRFEYPESLNIISTWCIT